MDMYSVFCQIETNDYEPLQYLIQVTASHFFLDASSRGLPVQIAMLRVNLISIWTKKLGWTDPNSFLSLSFYKFSLIFIVLFAFSFWPIFPFS
jgi:hypothetical protein